MKKGLFFTVVIALFIISCKHKEIKEVSMQEDVRILANDSLKGRETGSQTAYMAADYIQGRFEQLGLRGGGENNSYFQEFTFKPKTDPHAEIEYTNPQDSTITGKNVLGYLDAGAAETVIIGAHFDHLGMGGEGSLHRGENAIHNGADDNASGVAVMLALAKALGAAENLQNNYLFMGFSGEEMGLLGSNFFTKNPTLDLEQVRYMINLDMVGRLREDKTLSISGTGTTPLWNQVLQSNNTGFELVLQESGVGPSDHTSFYLQDIPVLHFFTGQHEDYHKPTDDAEKLNYQGMQQIADYLFKITQAMESQGEVAFRKTKNESEEVPRFKVGLGVVPDYLFGGEGMRIDGVSEEKPAQKAGLQKGDVVIQMGDSTITDMMSYMRALSAFDKGDKTEVIVLRNGTQIQVDIEF